MSLLLDQPVPLGSGPRLTTTADVALAQTRPGPVVVLRTMYDRTRHRDEARDWAQGGYHFVAADVRGRYAGEGRFVPFRNERADGAALADWVLDQPWCDGRIIAYGGSYSAYTAWCLAVQRPEAVRAVISQVPTMELATTKFDRAGILRLAEHCGWWLAHGDCRTTRPDLPARAWHDDPGLIATLPVAAFPDRSGLAIPGWWPVAQQGRDHEADERITDQELAALDVASWHTAGWYDVALEQALRLYDVVGRARPGRPPRRLLVGPWEHDLGAQGTRLGERDHGPASSVPLGRKLVHWLDRVLASDPLPDAADAFVVGSGRWTSWPSTTRRQSLHPGADGTLSTAPPAAATVTFVHDPQEPFPSVRACYDRSSLGERADAVRFASDPVARPVLIAGTPAAQLTVAASSAADWVARLVEHRPDGQWLELSAGAVRTAGYDACSVRVELDPLAVEVASGSRIVLEICGADFPRLARNLGVGDRLTGRRLRPVRQQVAVGPGQSWLELPVAA